jgi:ElaB/YqjD/DUF883 family membrane-anchored ribosome-binding protein
MSEVFLGVIAVATLVMALVQVGVLVAGVIAVKRMNEVLVRVEDSARPVLAHVDDLVVDATASLAAMRAQLDRVERQAVHVLTRTDQAVQRVQEYVVAPAREGIALAAGVRALFGAFRTPLLRVLRSALG